MTLGELNEYFRLLDQLSRVRELLLSLEGSTAPGSPVLNGLPGAPGYGDSIGKLAAEIADMRTRVESLEGEVRQKQREIESYVTGISDDQTRLIFRLRFLRGLSWGEVAAIIGGGNTEGGVKKRDPFLCRYRPRPHGGEARQVQLPSPLHQLGRGRGEAGLQL